MTATVDFRPDLGPVRDQGARPTCLAHAVSTAHEQARASTVQLSPEYLHYFASDGTLPHAGVRVSAVLDALRERGQPTEEDCPYHLEEPCQDWHPPEGLVVHRRESAVLPTLGNEVEMSLTTGCAPVLGITLPDSFHAPVPPWLISPEGAIVGFHAVLAVGMAAQDGERRFLIRNSWGSDWAQGGHAWLDESFLDRHLRNVLVLKEEALN